MPLSESGFSTLRLVPRMNGLMSTRPVSLCAEYPIYPTSRDRLGASCCSTDRLYWNTYGVRSLGSTTYTLLPPKGRNPASEELTLWSIGFDGNGLVAPAAAKGSSRPLLLLPSVIAFGRMSAELKNGICPLNCKLSSPLRMS